MAIYIKGNVQFTPVVEQINRKWATKSKTCSTPKKVGPVITESNSWMGSGTRIQGRAGIGDGVRKNYFIFRENARISSPKAAELSHRSNFTEGNKWANAAQKDLMAISTNQATWKTLRDNPEAYIAIGDDRLYAKGYGMVGFMRAYAIKQKAYDASSLPQDHLLPSPTIPA